MDHDPTEPSEEMYEADYQLGLAEVRHLCPGQPEMHFLDRDYRREWYRRKWLSEQEMEVWIVTRKGVTESHDLTDAAPPAWPD